MGTVEIVIIIIGVILIGFCLVQAVKWESDKQKMQDERIARASNSIAGFTPKIKITGVKSSYVFGIDEDSKQIALTLNGGSRVIPFDKIISVEVLEDNKTLSSKSSIRTIGGAVVGGALAGGAGMVVGGLSGNSTNKKKVSALKVKIKVRDLNNPNLIIPCFDAQSMCGSKEIKPDGLFSEMYKQAVTQANRIADLVSVIIDAEDRKEKKSEHSSIHSSMADELEKLAKLREQGILTDEEFIEQKKKLLNAPVQTPKVESQDEGTLFKDVQEVPADVQEAINKGKIVLATKLYMQETGCDAKEAADFVLNHK